MTRVALVTGSAQGIGPSFALRLARDGYTLALTEVNAAGASAIRDEIVRTGGSAFVRAADLARREDVKRAIARAAEWGPLAVLVNNAGHGVVRPSPPLGNDRVGKGGEARINPTLFVYPNGTVSRLEEEEWQ